MNWITSDKDIRVALSAVMCNVQNWNKRQTQSPISAQFSNDQDNSWQDSDMIYEIMAESQEDPLSDA